MKKGLIVLFYTFILSIFTIVITNTYAKTDNINKKDIVEIQKESNTENNGNDNTEIEEQKKQEIIEEVTEETESTEYVETSTTEEYVEEYTPVAETYYVNYGTYGRINVYGYSAALYDYNVNTYSSSSLQEIVNNEDSAAFYRNKGKLVIADHNYQGFSVLTYLTEGDTAYIEFEDGSIIRYTLIKKSKGYNTGPDLVDTEGNSFFYMDSDIIMYTCYDDGIMATLWVLS
ncbi:MAG: hypothetical protein IKF36_06770 [Bacilli bacterium]|nr:hypothetical protein [Bacilli bacterium]